MDFPRLILEALRVLKSAIELYPAVDSESLSPFRDIVWHSAVCASVLQSLPSATTAGLDEHACAQFATHRLPIIEETS